MLTIRPQPASNMSGSTAWVTWKTPLRLTSITFFHSSKVMLVKRRNDVMPAAFTRIVMGPSAAAYGVQRLVDLAPIGDVGDVAEVGVRLGQIDGRDVVAVRPAVGRRLPVPMPDAPPVTSAVFMPRPPVP